MFGISGFKWLIIIVAALILVGPEKLPEIGRTIGKAIAMFRRAQSDMSAIMRAEMLELESTTKEKKKSIAEVAKEQEEEAAEEASSDTVAASLYEGVSDSTESVPVAEATPDITELLHNDMLEFQANNSMAGSSSEDLSGSENSDSPATIAVADVTNEKEEEVGA